jgi:DNA segregation ATPase FtsK/SpoIIIE, S-DNA-T family
MEYEVTVVDRAGQETPVVVEAGEEATVGGLRAALAADPLYLDGVLLPEERRLADLPLVPGGLLCAGSSAVDLSAAAMGREIAVVGGLSAGASVPLSHGTVLVGRSPECHLALADPEVSRRHAVVRIDGAGTIAVADADSRNGIVWRGFRLNDKVSIEDGEVLRLGETVLAARRCVPPDVKLELDPACRVSRFNRPPRIVPPRRRPEVAVPARPERPKGFRFPLATVLVPLLLGAVLYQVMPDSKLYLLFLAFSPLMAIASVVSERRSGRREYREKLRIFEAELAAARSRLAELAVAEGRVGRELLPDPATVVRIATGPTGRLFERRPADDDFLRLRVGLTDRPVDVRLTGPGAEREEPPTAYGAPAAIDLAAAGVVGIAGPRPAVLSIARAMLLQAATLHAPHDLGIVLLTGRDEADEWEWASWLPHTLPHRAEASCRRMVATDREQAEARTAELSRLMAERREEGRAGLRDRVPAGRRLLLVLDGARRLRSVSGLADVLAEGPALGIYALCLDQAEPDLPDECRTTVVAANGSGTRVILTGPSDVLADGVPLALAERVARRLAPVRVLGARLGADGDLPDSARYLDLAGLGPTPQPDDVIAGWAAQPGGRSTAALLGVGPTGPVVVDLRRDGPHALIAGTSGSGKSELLQTLVASLALGNAPDALNLVLVDYKGGSAFADCRDLPHCVGMVTDLDGHLAGRALASLSAELRRREAILAEAGAKDIEDFWARTGGRLPRLVIVIDEFATLAEEVPDFMTGVVGIGMRGRSLGVHIVLATQRPGGVVNAEIRANVNLRLCLRVTRAEESTDVIDVPDAARISRLRPGRAYLRTGHSDLTTVQCARIGWPRGDAPLASAARAVRVDRRRISELGRTRRAEAHEPGAGHAGETDLTAVVAAIRVAAAQTDVSAPSSPWLPPLPGYLTLAELEPVPTTSPVTATIGLADHPAAQAQMSFSLDLDESGPVVVVGMARSGRSTVLRTIAASLATRSGPTDLHLYVLDYGGRALAPLAALPHCGAFVDGDEPDRVERLLNLLTSEIDRRGRVLAAGDHGSLREQRAAVAPSARIPYVVLLVDRYEIFLARHAETDGGRLVEILDGLLRRGPAVGILPVLSTDRSGFTHRINTAIATRLVLRQADPGDMAVFGVGPTRIPRSMPPGRALAVPADVEVQIALLAVDADGAAQAVALAALAVALAARWDGADPNLLPHRVDPLPQRICLAELAELRTGPPSRTPTACTVGVGGDHLAPVEVDLAESASLFLVSGPPRSGRSGALAAVVESLAGRASGHLPVLVCCPRPSPLTGLADLPGVVDVLSGPELWPALESVLAQVPGPVAVVVDDAELLAEGPAADILERLARTARDHGNLVIAAGTTEDLMLQRYRGWLAALRRARYGLLLNPLSYVDGEVFDVRLPRSTGGGWPPGRALLVQRGATVAVQVPHADARLTGDEGELMARLLRPDGAGRTGSDAGPGVRVSRQ